MSDSIENEQHNNSNNEEREDYQQPRETISSIRITEESLNTAPDGNEDSTGYLFSSSTRRTFSGTLDDDDDLASSSSSYRSSRLASRYSSNRYSAIDDDDLASSSALTSRYSTNRFRSSYLDDDDLSATSTTRSTRLSRYAREADDDYSAGYSTSRFTSRYSSALQDDDDYSGSSYTRRTTRLTSSYLSRDDDDDFDRLSTSSRHSRYSTSRRLTSDIGDSFYRVSSPGLDDDDALSTTSSTRRYQAQYSIDSLNEDFGSSSSIRRRFQSSRSVSRTDPKDAGQVYEAILDYKPPRAATDEICLKEGQEVIVLDKQKPHKWLVKTRKTKAFSRVEEGYAPSAYLKATNETVDLTAEPRSVSQERSDDTAPTTPTKDDAAIQKDLKKKKDMIVRELIETEEDLVRDMQLVQRTYIRQSESAITPKEIKAVKDQLFSCYKDLLNFHNNHLLKNFQSLSKDPAKIGTLFLRMEEQFEDHTKYCKNLPKALEILDDNLDVSEFFANYAVKVRDDKSLADHLKLPYQRISDYQLLLKEISKHLARMGENVDDLEKAIKMVSTIPNKGTENDDDDNDNENNDEQAKQKNIPSRPDSAAMGEKLSDKLKSVLQAKGYVDLVDSMGKTEERFIFLFKTRLFIADVNKNAQEGQRAYETKQIIQLEDIDVEVDSDKPNMLIIKSKDLSDHSFPIGLKCKTIQQAREWYEIMIQNSEPNDDNIGEEEKIVREESPDVVMMMAMNNSSKSLKSSSSFNESPDMNNNIVKNLKLNHENEKIEIAQKSIINENNKDETVKESEATINSKDDKPFSFKTATRKDSLTKEEAEEIKKLIQKQDEKFQKNKLCILEPLKAVTRHWGETAIFECKIQSESSINIQWLKDNRILSGNNYRTIKKDNNIYVLELMDLCPDDAGLYTFIASNSKDTVSCCSTLNVLSADSRPTSPGGSFLPHPPKFKVKLKDTELREGTTVRFELIVRGLPIPQLSFYKNDKPLYEDDHLRIVYQSKEVFEIVFDNIKQSDAGRYKVRAINPEGEDLTEAQITVNPTKNVFWGLPDDAMERAAIEEARARSSSRAHSPAFKWFCDGKEFEASERFQVQYDTEEDNIVLIFQHVKPEDAGLYTCVASTSSSKITCSAELTVQGVVKQLDQAPIKPEIKRQLTDIKATVGENVIMLEAQIAGFPKPKMVWTKNGKEILADERHKLLLEGNENYALLIKNIEDEDEGKYKLKAVNELGEAETEAELTVCKRPKVFMVQDNIEIMDQEDIIIKAKYEAVPKPNILWLKDGVEIKDSLKRVKTNQDETEASLLIQKATIQDAGLYTCQVTNNLGSSQGSVEAIVNSSPKFLKRMEAIEILEDEQATFEVIVSNSNPKAQVEWFYKTNKLVENEKIKFVEEVNGRYLLKILNGKKNDAGQYGCKVKNPYGGEECQAELTIKKLESKPEFTQKLKDIEAKIEETNIKFEVATSGEPKPVLKWFHNGEALTSKTKGIKIQETPQGSNLIIEQVSLESHGQYVCKAESVTGTSETAANLTVIGPPYVVKELEDQEQPLEAEVRLTSIIKGNPQPEVVWYCNGKAIKLEPGKRVAGYDETSTEYYLTIYKLTNEDIGAYRLEAKNQFGSCETKAKIEVIAKPLFTKVLKNVQCQLMETNIEFVVQLDKHNAKTLVKWFKDDKEIKPDNSKFKMFQETKDNSYKLTILKATEEVVGKFKAQASNDCGTAETSARLDIVKAPKFLEELQNMNVKEGESVAIKVLIDACPAAEVVLIKDGQDMPVKMTPKPVMNKDGCIEYVAQLVGVKEPDAGVWLCRATNIQGVVESKAALLVQTAPKILQDLANAQIGQGQEIALKMIIANSEPAPAVKWLKNGVPVQLGVRARVEQPKQGEHILKITDAMEIDSGAYQAIVENPLGIAESKQAKIEIIKNQQAPKFIKKIEDAIVVVEDSVRFEAKIEANPSAEVTWYCDGTQLKTNERVAIKQEDGSHILILRHLTIKDSGIISCKATNPAGSVTDTANLNVHEPTLPVITGLRDNHVIEGEPFKLIANVTGFPRPFVSWFLNGVEIESDIIYSEPQNNLYTLNFKSFTAENAGEYTCRAANSAGQALEQCEILIGGAKPHFTQELAEDITMSVGKENGKLKIGQAAIFETIVVGSPMPKVTWLKNNVPLRNSDRVVITTPEDETNGEHRMEIKNITKDDVASYTCLAVNQYGEAQSICLLKYLNEPHQPIIKKPLENIKIEEGEPLTLFCKVDGEPMPSVKWFKNNNPLETEDEHIKIISASDGGTKLCIEKATMNDAAKYEVKADNVKGSVCTSSIVTVVKPQRPPKFIKELPEEIKVESNSPIIIEAEIFGLPTPTILWSKNGKPITESSSRMKLQEIVGPKEGNKVCKLQITQGRQEDIGVYTLKVNNQNGEALSESHIKVQPEPQAPKIVENLPIKVKAIEGEPLELHAKVTSYPLPEVKWAHDQVPIKESDQRAQIIVNPDGNLTLTIHPSTVGDSGVFTLTVSNPVGEIAITTNVEVSPKDVSKNISKDDQKDALKDASKDDQKDALKDVSKDALKDASKDALKDDLKDASKDTSKDISKDNLKNDLKDAAKDASKDISKDNLKDDLKDASKGDLKDNLKDASKDISKDALKDDLNDASKDTSNDATKAEEAKKIEEKEEKENEKLKKSEKDNLGKFRKESLPKNSLVVEKQQQQQQPETICLEKSKESGKLEKEDFKEGPKRKSNKKKSVKKQEQIERSSPVVLQGLSDQAVLKNDNVKLTVFIKSNPEPEIVWYHNEVPIKLSNKNIVTKHDETSTEYSLTILEFNNDNIGNYRFEAKNELGVCFTKANIELVDENLKNQISLLNELESKNQKGIEPIVMRGLSNQTVPKDNDVKLSAIIKGNPKPEIVWYCNDTKIKIDKTKFTTDYDETSAEYFLTIYKFNEDNIGEYKIEAKNIYGSCLTEAKLDIIDEQKIENIQMSHYGPFVVKHLQNKETSKDVQVKLYAIIKGKPEPNVIWYHNNVPIEICKNKNISASYDETSAEYFLTIFKFTDANVGEYCLEAKNKFGSCFTKSMINLIDHNNHDIITSLPDTPGVDSLLERTRALLEQSKAIFDRNNEIYDNHNNIEIKNFNQETKSFLNDKENDNNKEFINSKFIKQDLPSEITIKSSEDLILEVKIEPKLLEELSIEKKKPQSVNVIWKKDGIPLDKNKIEQISQINSGEEIVKICKPNHSDSGIYSLTIEKPDKSHIEISCAEVKFLNDNNDNNKICFAKSFPKQVCIEPKKSIDLKASIRSSNMLNYNNDINIFKNGKLLKNNDDNIFVSVYKMPEGTQEICLKKDNLDIQDTGVYRIEVKASNNDILNTECFVNIIDKHEAKEVQMPKILSGLKPIEIESGQAGKLELKVDGDACNFDVAWFKDGEQILPNEQFGIIKLPDGTIALQIDSFTAVDAGKYSVKIENSQGAQIEDETSATLKKDKIISIPIIVEPLKSIEVNEDSPLVFTTKVASSGAPFKATWFFENKPLTERDGVKFLVTPDGIVALQIDKASLKDSGKYRVEISNDSGKVSSDGSATVKPKEEKMTLEMLSGLKSTVFTAGKSGQLELQVGGVTDNLDIKFLKDGQAIVPNDLVHIRKLPNGIIQLNFDRTELNDAGDYSVIISAVGTGQVQSKCQVQVKSKPIITKHLIDLEVKEGCTAKFEIEIEANPPAEIKWMINGRSIGSNSQAIQSSDSNGTYYLTIDKCSFRDEAIYSVAVSNELGTEKSEGKLCVIGDDKFEESKPEFLNNLTDIIFKIGDSFTFEANIKAHPSPTLIWCKNGIPINESDKRFVTFFDGSHASLTIKDANMSDVGEYSLTVSNKLGEATSKAKSSIQANTVPKFVKKLQNGEYNLKNDLKLSCRAEGFPNPNICWKFNGKEIQCGSKYSIFTESNGDFSLIIFSPNEFDSGTYECVASNCAGSDNTTSNIQFINQDGKGEAAAFIKKLIDYDVLNGGTAYFTGCVIGSPKPELVWFLNGSTLDISESKFKFEYQENGMFKLEIHDVTEADLGKYQCRASNVYGSDNSIAQLSFEKIGLDRSKSTHKSMKSQARAESVELKTGGIPDALTDSPQISKMTDDSLTLVWSPSIPEKARFPVSYIIEFGKAMDGVWMIYQANIRDNKCEVIGLDKFTDYNFRVRVENKFGQSDPSPHILAERSRLKDEDSQDKKSRDFKIQDYDIEHKERGHVAAAPKFLREEPSSMFGIVDQPVTIEFWVHGFPDPDIQWFYGDRLLEHSNVFSFLHDRNGRVCLFINKMTGLDAGDYTCVARNEHGEARQTIRLVEAHPPVFTRKLEETTVASRGHARLEVKFESTPECSIKWFKDFKSLHDTGRATILNTGDSSSLALSELMVRDSGLYSCTITNIAGSSTTSAYLKVTDTGVSFDRYPSQYHQTVKAKNKTVESYYDLGDELGRGTQGITYHSVERDTGKSFSAKMMHGIGESRKFMQQELDIMNQLGTHEHLVQLHDAFAATPHSMTLITDLCGGGPILDYILSANQINESQIADYMKQILEGLYAMHIKNIGHFGLTIGDILLDRLNGLDVKIADFGLSARVIPGMTHFVEYGHPEYASPEIVDKTTVTFGADIWSAGIVAYIMLTGISPFLGENDRATLQNIKEKKGLDLSDEALKNISKDGRDFLRKTLNWNPSARPDSKTLLNHSWFRSARQQTSSLDIIQSLRNYQSKYTKWYENASCKRYYRRRALHSCYTHPSRMIYPPDEQYSPVVSPDRELKKFQKPTASPFDNIYPASNRPDSEPFSSESHYQSGPETYLLQLRDTGFPTRIRRYLRIAASSSPSIAASLSGAHWGSNIRSSLTGYTPTVSIKERRKFTDIMDEEVNEEWRGNSFRSRPSRLIREVGTSGYAYGQMNILRREAKLSRFGTETPDNAKVPFFREKFRDCTFRAGEEIVVSCFAVGIPEPNYTWFRNESILIESSRIQVRRTAEGRCELILKPAREYDAGVYKCIARNIVGQAIARARISLGDIPDHISIPHAADISSNSILLTWSSPKYVNASCIKSYKLEMKHSSSGPDWITVNANICQEFYVVNELMPENDYYFRISATNQYGQSEPGMSSELIRTTNQTKTIGLPVGMQFVCNNTTEEIKKQLEYSREEAPVGLIASDYKEIFDFKSLITTGKFSVIAKTHIKDGSRAILACKCVLIQSEQESGIANEYNIMKTLAHERIVKLIYAHRDSQIFSLAMELTSGLNILTYFCRKMFYSEENVSLVISQVIDAIEYLHYRGIALLELQPDNVLVCDERKLQIKLCDFAKARPVKGPNAVKIDLLTDPEFIAPEVVKSQEAYTPYTDIWCIGVLAYILLSGHSPFKGTNQKETGQNVVYVRYLFDRLYPEVTQDAIRFILSVFKLTPHKRPTIEELIESKWLLPAESIIRRREIALFNSEKLRKYTHEFLAAKQLPQSRLIDLLGVREHEE